jgi:hypothetical protein
MIDKLESVKSRIHFHNIYDIELIDKVTKEDSSITRPIKQKE